MLLERNSYVTALITRLILSLRQSLIKSFKIFQNIFHHLFPVFPFPAPIR